MILIDFGHGILGEELGHGEASALKTRSVDVEGVGCEGSEQERRVLVWLAMS